jgi:hypothetical protein
MRPSASSLKHLLDRDVVSRNEKPEDQTEDCEKKNALNAVGSRELKTPLSRIRMSKVGWL